ncbi:MAG: molecular chaperone DnaK [Burkholderiaceae bacterium]|nr:molecular chaperone DnaK [Sulfuritalea sp.]MCF8174211.1 molecular chaperone DnaK [Burkholderiaceae bacterium]
MDTEYFHRRLTDELATIAETVAQARETSGIVELDQSSIGRVSRIDALQQQAMAQSMLERLQTRQRQIEAALDRIADDRFGLCCACEAELEPERLKADPATVCCMACAEARATR